jgi:hypothetical protein
MFSNPSWNFILPLVISGLHVIAKNQANLLERPWERATMSEERLCDLVMLHVHRDMNVSRENILRRFDETGHRKIGTLHFE